MKPSASVPEHLQSAFAKAEAVVSNFFAHPQFEPNRGTLEVDGERYLLVRAASLSVEFFDVVRRLYRDEGEGKAFAIAHSILYDVAHSLGRADARRFHEVMGLQSPIEKLSAGPIHFAHTGWAHVELIEEGLSASDPYLVYDHHHAFEADAWLEADRSVDVPVCTMNSGYSSGWVAESVGSDLAAAEILCRARGDECCRFVMAPPDVLEERIQTYLQSKPEISERITEFRVPGFFERKRIEAALRQREAQYRGVFEASTDALLIVSARGRILGANVAAEAFFGKPRKRLTSCSVCELLGARVKFERIRTVATAGETYQGELKLDRGEQPTHIELRGSAYRVDASHHILLSLRDITRQKQMQQQLYRADRLASLGTMAAGVAHEINNPLSFIISNLDVCLWDLDNDEDFDKDELREAIQRAKRGAERVARTVRDLTNFSHGGLDDSVEAVDVHRMLDLATQMVDKTIEQKGGRLIKSYGEVPPVLANESRLNQVFVNLLLNAAQALDPQDKGPSEVEISTAIGPEQQVVVTVRDTGVGIPDSIRERIFDPFFTTKAVDEGTGIGLAICHEIVQAIGGKISLHSEVGEGTTFEVVLPTQQHLVHAVGKGN